MKSILLARIAAIIFLGVFVLTNDEFDSEQTINRWVSGEVISKEKFKYGRYITKIKAPNKLGTCTAFFTYWMGNEFEPWTYEE